MTQPSRLMSPQQVMHMTQNNRLRPLNFPPPVPTRPRTASPVRLNSVSTLLRDLARVQQPAVAPRPALLPRFQQPVPQPIPHTARQNILTGLPAHIQRAHTQTVGRTVGVQPITSAAARQRQQIIVNSGLKEWQSGVKESGGRNQGPRINEYAKNSKFGKGYEWCGFFTAFNYSQAGFKHPESFASYQKARDFFLYRSYTSRDSGLHARLDQQREQDKASGSSRQYFAMAESNVFEYVDAYKRYYGHIDPADLKHTWQDIPIQPGDVALFNHGHVGMVISYDPGSGELVTVEGNTAGEGPDGKRWTQAVVRKRYDLSKASDRKKFDGFGRPADSDFE